MSVSYIVNKDQLVCSFSGKMDTASCINLKDSLSDKIKDHNDQAVVFDMKKVDYISSSFLRLCAITEVAAQSFSVVGTNPTVKRVFMIAGLDGKFNVQ